MSLPAAESPAPGNSQAMPGSPIFAQPRCRRPSGSRNPFNPLGGSPITPMLGESWLETRPIKIVPLPRNPCSELPIPEAFCSTHLNPALSCAGSAGLGTSAQELMTLSKGGKTLPGCPPCGWSWILLEGTQAPASPRSSRPCHEWRGLGRPAPTEVSLFTCYCMQFLCFQARLWQLRR